MKISLRWFGFCILGIAWLQGVTAVLAADDAPTNTKASGQEFSYDKIAKEQWTNLEKIRDSIAPIKNLDQLYQNRTHPNGLPYHVYAPASLEAGKKYPLVIFLHGYTDLSLGIHQGIPKGIWSLPMVQDKHPHILFIPRYRDNKDLWVRDNYHEMVMSTLDDLIKEFNNNPAAAHIDVNRIYLTGFSQGGMGVWNYLKKDPERFAAVCPLAGFSHGPRTVDEANAVKHVPIWIFNGDHDGSERGARLSYQMLKTAGASDVRYSEYLEHGHVIDDIAFFSDGFMDWLFAQHRASPATSGSSTASATPPRGAPRKPHDPEDSLATSELPDGVKLVSNVSYVPNSDKRNLLDLYLPEHAKEPFPAIVHIHGGGWQQGCKADGVPIWIVKKGFALVCINYHLSDTNTFPKQIEDCKAAVRWLRANATIYHIDPKHIGAWGFSAGGHLAALLGTSAGVKELEGKDGYLDQSSRVQAVLDICGPTDFTILPPDMPNAGILVAFFGTKDWHQNKKALADASPITYVNKQTPPFLILHGDQDDVVPIMESVLFSNKLKETGVEFTFKVLEGSKHGGPEYYAPENAKLIEEFFAKHLKNGEVPTGAD